MKTCPYLLHALTPLHVGTGQSMGGIDLPIARYKATQIPFVPGSALKGVLRAARTDAGLPADDVAAIFGPPKVAGPADEHAGALSVGDARLLALPIRSHRGTFAWTTCPLLLSLAKRDMEGACAVPAVPRLPGVATALVGGNGADDSAIVMTVGTRPEDRVVVLEDLDLRVQSSRDEARAWAEVLAQWVFPDSREDQAAFIRRFAVVDDESMSLLWETATQVDVRVSISPATRTAEDGQLWSEESLPAETLLLGLCTADRSRRSGRPWSPDEVLRRAVPGPELVQVGGKATVGRGRCWLRPIAGGAPR